MSGQVIALGTCPNVYNGGMKTKATCFNRSNRQQGKAAEAESAFLALLGEASQRGYYGSVSLTLNVQDGHIQHVRVATDRYVK